MLHPFNNTDVLKIHNPNKIFVILKFTLVTLKFVSCASVPFPTGNIMFLIRLLDLLQLIMSKENIFQKAKRAIRLFRQLLAVLAVSREALAI